MAKSRSECREPIAIVGRSCFFPKGANDIRRFWQLLESGVDAFSQIPSDRWDIRRFVDLSARRPGKAYTDQGAFLDVGIDQFDPMFFGISPREAECMDPQQRLLLELTWETLEDAGIPLETAQAVTTGVFIGGFCLDNKLTQSSGMNRRLIDANTSAGLTMAILANRLSYVFDLKGPSINVDTACSSSLVATHLACQSIWHGESDCALAGGVNIMTRPEYMIAMSKGQFLSRQGRSMAFDARAGG